MDSEIEQPVDAGQVRLSSRKSRGCATAWTKHNKKGGEFMALQKPAKKKTAAKKFKGIRRERK